MFFLLSPVLFLLFINDVVSVASFTIHFYAVNFTCSFHYFETPFSLKYDPLQSKWRWEKEWLWSTWPLILFWGERKSGSFQGLKITFLLDINLFRNYIIFFKAHFSTFLNIFDTNFPGALIGKDHILFLSKQLSKRMGIIGGLRDL